nr:MAG TPA_asm: hypothetical protein [Caudoviricetes sp.]
MVKNLRYNIANSLFRDKASLKAIALLLYFYHKHYGKKPTIQHS